MATKPLKSLKFPTLDDTYTVPQVDDTLAVQGAAADAKKVGDELTDIKGDISQMNTATASDVGKALLAKTVADGKVTEWEFGEAGGEVESSDIDINILDIAGEVTVHSGTTLNITGEVGSGTGNSNTVREFAIPSGYSKARFKAFNTSSSNKVWCLYNASTFENCSPETLVASGYYQTANSNLPINIINITDECKILLILARDTLSMCTLFNIATVEKSLLDFANPFDRLVAYNSGEYCIYEGKLYKKKIDSVAEEWNAEKWEQVSYASERQFKDNFLKYSPFVIGRINSTTGEVIGANSGVISQNIIHVERDMFLTASDLITGLVIYYYRNKYDRSLCGQVDMNSPASWRYVPKGSYIRPNIGASSIPSRADTINKIASLLTFNTVLAKQSDDINKGSDAYYVSEVSNMFQKGATPKEFVLPPCILVAGQSNIDGRVPHASLPAEMDIALPNIMDGSDNGTFSAQGAPTGKVGIDWPMFYKLNEIGTTFYKIKKSLGGTAISPLGSTQCWTPFYEELTNISNSLLLAFDKKIKKCLEVTPNTFDIRAFVWQQGEGDFVSQSGGPRMTKKSIDYYKNFKCLVAYVRGVAGNKRLPVVCGTVSHRSGEYDPYVEAATLKVAEEDPYMICIDMSGAKLLDSFHFNADSAVYFGYKAFDALIDLGVITGTKINPTKPWEDYTVTEDFTNCYSNAYADDTVRYDGQSLTRNIYADTGYTIDSVTVTMNGEDITATAYSAGTITISDVQGDIVITATATANA